MSNLIDALKQIRDLAMESPEFDCELFEQRDFKGICEVGGAVADWTTLAIIADDAIKTEEE